LCDELGEAPDTVILPVGNGGNIRAIWKGFLEYRRLGLISKLPRLIGVQAEGAAWLRDGPLDSPQTVATAIRIGKAVNARYAEAAILDSNGMAVAVSDEEILAAQKKLASEHGIFAEPASAAPLAALTRIEARGTIVCVATGHGLKDPDITIESILVKPEQVAAVLGGGHEVGLAGDRVHSLCQRSG
jgi:threonine synthase